MTPRMLRKAVCVITGRHVTYPTVLCDFPSEQKWRREHQVKCYLCERFGKLRVYDFVAIILKSYFTTCLITVLFERPFIIEVESFVM